MVFKWKNGELVKESYFWSPEPNNWNGTDSLLVEGCIVSDRSRRFMMMDWPCGWSAFFSCEYFT